MRSFNTPAATLSYTCIPDSRYIVKTGIYYKQEIPLRNTINAYSKNLTQSTQIPFKNLRKPPPLSSTKPPLNQNHNSVMRKAIRDDTINPHWAGTTSFPSWFPPALLLPVAPCPSPPHDVSPTVSHFPSTFVALEN